MKFETLVPIKDELKKCLIIGLRSRVAIAIVLGFTGYQHEVLPLMYNLSHKTRAFIVNANGLPAFVSSLTISIIELLQEADKNG